MLSNEGYPLWALHKLPAAAFDLYIQKITENFLLMKEKAITGPILRKDILTINKNIEALSGTVLQAIYQAIYQISTQEFLKWKQF